jgi:hypothetical protein
MFIVQAPSLEMLATGITWYNTVILIIFVVFHVLLLLLRCFQKFDAKFWSCSDLFQNFEILDLAMVKVGKVNIAVTYLSEHTLFIISHVESTEEKGL